MTQKKTLLLCLAAIMSMLFASTVQARDEIDRIDTPGGTLTFSGQNNSWESAVRIFDGNTGTKWLDNTTGTPFLQLDFADDEAYVIDNYKLTYANDDPSRAPKDWVLEGSNDGAAWTVISTVTGQTNWALFEERAFETQDPNVVTSPNTEAYKMYKLDVTANNGSGIFQLAELTLLNGTEKIPTITGVLSARSQIHEGEGFMKAIDNTMDTKWLGNGPDANNWLLYQFISTPFAINGYSISSCNDAHERDPKQWTLEASNDGSTWTPLDSRSGQSWANYKERHVFEFDNSTPYYFYRINLLSDSNLTGMSEFELLSIQDDPIISTVSPVNFSAISADPVVLSWTAVRKSAEGTFNVYVTSGSTPVFESLGMTASELEIPAGLITDDTVYTWHVDIVDDPYETGTPAVFAGASNKFRVLRHTEKVLEWSMDSFGSSTEYGYEMPVTGVSVIASSIEGDNRAANLTLGAGFSVDPSIPDPNGLQHSYGPWDSWISHPDQEGTTWIQYSFEEETDLGTMFVWNHNCDKDRYDSENNRGMKNVVVSYSLDENEDPNLIELGSYLIPIGTGIDGAGPSIAIPFDGIRARTVRISAAEEDSNWGAAGNMHALAEVRFGKFGEKMISHTMADGSGKGNNAATYNSPELVSESVTGLALDLKITGSLFLARNNPSVETLPLGLDANCNSSWSMNFYTLLPEQAADLSFFVGFGDFEQGTGRYIAKFADGIHFWGGNNVDGVSNVQFDLNRWQMITATYADGVLKMYKNKDEIFNGPATLGLASANVTVGGNSPWGTTNLDGIFDSFTMYRGALSQTEIDELYDALPTQYDALNPTPAIGAVNVVLEPVLSWEAPLSAYDPTYTIYMGTDSEYMTLVADGLVDTSFDLVATPLDYGTTYYWMVDTSSGEPSGTWSFTTLDASSAAAVAFGMDFESSATIVMNYEAAVPNITATASSFEQPSTWREPYKAVNGYGLTIDPLNPDASTGMSHSNQATMGWCTAADRPEKPWIKFEFDQPYPLGTMLVWNHNVDPTWASETDRGMRNVIVRYTSDPVAAESTEPNDWTTLGAFEIPRGSNDPDFIPYSIAIPFGNKSAQFVRIDAGATDSNWGNANNMHGLAQVRFGIFGTKANTVTVPDISGNGNFGYGVGGPAFVTGIDGGTAVKLDGSVQSGIKYFESSIADATVLPLAAADMWSMNMYVNLATNPASPTLFGGFGGSDQGTGRFFGRFGGVHFWGGSNTDRASATQYRYGQWQMLTATYAGSELSVYLNGVPVSKTTITFADAAEYITIGGLNPWNNPINALVDDFTIYAGVLTRAEIAALAARMPVAGDMDWNGTVDMTDLSEMLGEWLTEGVVANPADLSGDTNVNLLDIAVLAENWMMN